MTRRIAGAKVEYIVEDDGNDANRTRAAARNSLKKDKIFVMGAGRSAVPPGSGPVLESMACPSSVGTGSSTRTTTRWIPTTVSVAGRRPDLPMPSSLTGARDGRPQTVSHVLYGVRALGHQRQPYGEAGQTVWGIEIVRSSRSTRQTVNSFPARSRCSRPM